MSTPHDVAATSIEPRKSEDARTSNVRNKAGWSKAALTLLPLGILLVLALADVPLCPTKTLFGVPCPGCGLTRATFAMFQGDWHGVMHFHPLAPLVAPILGWMFLHSALKAGNLWPSNWPDIVGKLPRSFWIGLTVAMLGLWLIRLAGGLGGTADPIDPSQAWVGRALSGFFS